jgi:hypothetical protein
LSRYKWRRRQGDKAAWVEEGKKRRERWREPRRDRRREVEERWKGGKQGKGGGCCYTKKDTAQSERAEFRGVHPGELGG